jgi:hypothetical protein
MPRLRQRTNISACSQGRLRTTLQLVRRGSDVVHSAEQTLRATSNPPAATFANAACRAYPAPRERRVPGVSVACARVRNAPAGRPRPPRALARPAERLVLAGEPVLVVGSPSLRAPRCQGARYRIPIPRRSPRRGRDGDLGPAGRSCGGRPSCTRGRTAHERDCANLHARRRCSAVRPGNRGAHGGPCQEAEASPRGCSSAGGRQGAPRAQRATTSRVAEGKPLEAPSRRLLLDPAGDGLAVEQARKKAKKMRQARSNGAAACARARAARVDCRRRSSATIWSQDGRVHTGPGT